MQQKEFLGGVDATRSHIAICKVEEGEGLPGGFEVWFNRDFVNWEPYAYHQAADRIRKQSGGRWRLGFQEVNTGLLKIYEDPMCPMVDGYGSDRAVSDAVALLLEVEKPGIQEIAEKRLNAEIIRKAAAAKKNKSATV